MLWVEDNNLYNVEFDNKPTAKDYEVSFSFMLVDRHRYHREKDRPACMLYDVKSDAYIYSWFYDGTCYRDVVEGKETFHAIGAATLLDRLTGHKITTYKMYTQEGVYAEIEDVFKREVLCIGV
jgi:hypothetical protein